MTATATEISVKDLIVGEIYELEGVIVDHYFTVNCFVRITSKMTTKTHSTYEHSEAYGYIWESEEDDFAYKDEDEQTYRYCRTVDIRQSKGENFDNKSIVYQNSKGMDEVHYFKYIKPHTDNILRAMKNAAAADEEN